MEGVLLETAKGLDTTGSLCFCKIEEDKKVSRPGFAVVPKDSLEISQQPTGWLVGVQGQRVRASDWRTPNHESCPLDWGPDWPIDGHQNHANVSSFARCPSAKTLTRDRNGSCLWTFGGSKRGRLPPRVRLVVHLRPLIATNSPTSKAFEMQR